MYSFSVNKHWLVATMSALVLAGNTGRANTYPVAGTWQSVETSKAFDDALASADAAIKMGDKAGAASKYAQAAAGAPTRTDIALKAVSLYLEAKQYIDAASLAASVRDMTKVEADRKLAAQYLERLQPFYQKSADLQFVGALRRIRAGADTNSEITVLEKVRRLVFDPQEGLLTLAFAEFGAGRGEKTVTLLAEWLQSARRSPDEIARIRLATYYDSTIVSNALADDDIHNLLVRSFGKFAANRLNRVIEDGRVAEEPIIKTINAKDGALMLLIPAGKFLMGDKGIPNNPRRAITLSEYWIYEKLVTVDMYRRFCKAVGRQMPPEPVYTEVAFNAGWKKGTHPIVNVSWADALAYCKWAEVRLPTEAEWEKAARGTEGRRYPWGSQYNPHLLHHSYDDGDARGTAPVGTFPAGASPYGALDMAGMVFQWCSDYYMADYWKYSPQKDPTGPTSGNDRVVRSGSWYDDDDVDFVSARRTSYAPNLKYIYAGFRCASKP